MKFYSILFALVFLGLSNVVLSQNPLKKEIKEGAKSSMYYSTSQAKFANNTAQSVFVSDVVDNRSDNWNKQLNDSIKIDLIRDFWNYPYVTLVKNKMNQDLSKLGIKLEFTPSTANYVIQPKVEIHFPNYIVAPRKGYYVLTKLNMIVTKSGNSEFKKAYQDYFYFGPGDTEWKDSYTSDYYEGTNAAMWVGMRRLLDVFYQDLNLSFGGQKVSEQFVPMETLAKSNVANDPNIEKKQTSYANAKDKVVDQTKISDNYRMEDKVELPPPTDDKLDKAISTLSTNAKDKKDAVKPKPAPVVSVPKPVKKDSVTTAARKVKEDAKNAVIDSMQNKSVAMSVKAKDDEKSRLKQIAGIEKAKKDSIISANKKQLADRLRERNTQDSIRRSEASKQMDMARKKREEEKKKLQANTKTVDSTIRRPNPTPSQSTAIAAAQKPVKVASNGTLSDELRRIAKEVELEEKGVPVVRSKSTPVPQPTISSISKEDAKKANIEADKTKLEAEKKAKEQMIAKLKLERETRLAKLEAERKSKDSINKAVLAKRQEDKKIAEEKKIADAKKLAEEKRLAAIKPVDPKKLAEDSMKLEAIKKQRREAILAAQKSAIEAEREALIKNPNAGEMFALVSTDPPSKLPDYRTRDQVLADRIFTPKSELSKTLLNRVKLITPEEEMKMLNTMKTSDPSSVDSFYIEFQKNRPADIIDTAAAPKVAPKKGDKSKSTKSTLDTAKSKSQLGSKVKNAKDKAKVDTSELKKAAKDELKKVETKAVDTTKAAKKANIVSKVIAQAPKKDSLPAAPKVKQATTKDADKLNEEINQRAEELKKNTEKLKKEAAKPQEWD